MPPAGLGERMAVAARLSGKNNIITKERGKRDAVLHQGPSFSKGRVLSLKGIGAKKTKKKSRPGPPLRGERERRPLLGEGVSQSTSE